jgi:hypothetical protein
MLDVESSYSEKGVPAKNHAEISMHHRELKR